MTAQITQTPSRQNTFLRIFTLLFSVLFYLFAYTFLHEFGHALTGLLSGGTLTSFSIDFITFTAHAGIEGEFSQAQRALISIAGIGLPLFLWTAFLLRVKGSTRVPGEDPVLDWLLLMGSAGVYGTLLAWVIIPILVLSGQQVSDDSANFLHITGIHPLLVSAGALAAMAGGIALFIKQMGGLAQMKERLQVQRTPAALTPASRATLRKMAAVLLILALANFAVSAYARTSRASAVPEGYSLAFSSEQSGGALDQEVMYSFQLDAPALVSFYLMLSDFQEGPLDITLTGPGGMTFNFLHFEEKPGIGHATVHPRQIPLEAGGYEIRVTAPQASSRLEGFMKIEASP